MLDYVILDPNRLDKTEDRNDLEQRCWTCGRLLRHIGCTGGGHGRRAGELARLRHAAELPLGDPRKFPIGARGTVSFEIRRAIDHSARELTRRSMDLLAAGRPASGCGGTNSRWTPKRSLAAPGRRSPFARATAEQTATASVGKTERTLPMRDGRLGLSYLTAPRSGDWSPERGATDVRRLRVQVQNA